MAGPTNPQRVLLLWKMPDGTNGSVQFDATLSEQHTTSAQVTDHPVESGPNVSDHIRVLPKKLALTAIVTNTPIYVPKTQMRGIAGAPGQFTDQVMNANGLATRNVNWSALQFSDEFDRVSDVYVALVDAVSAGALFSVVNTMTAYENMAITNLSAPRNAASGNSVTFQIDMQEIRIVETQTVAALPGKVKPRGNKPTRDATKKEEEKAKEDIDPLTQIGRALGGH